MDYPPHVGTGADGPVLGERGDLGEVAEPLARLICSADLKVLGLAGVPGSGKSTLAAALAAHLREQGADANPIVASLDDFYLSRAERDARGIRFRASLGSHDLAALAQVLDAARRGDRVIVMPRFDHGLDDRVEAERCAGPASPLLIEGIFVGLTGQGYGVLANQLDYLIYLDCPLSLARERRLAREAQLRRASGGQRGLSAEAMQTFWDDVLGPIAANHIMLIRQRADLVLGLYDEGRLARVVNSEGKDVRIADIPHQRRRPDRA